MTPKDYAILYRRFLKRSPDELLDLAGFKAGDRVLDLCAGGGRASIAALARGASWVDAVDNGTSIKTISPFSDPSTQESVFMYWPLTSVGGFLDNAHCSTLANVKRSFKYDCVICQQAINYWFSKTTAALLPYVVAPGGSFVFNTFNTKPSKIPTVKSYSLQGRKYSETSYLVHNMIYHVQSCEGFEPDIQKFAWISRRKFESVLSKYFEKITVKTDGKTDLWLCRKPIKGE